MFVKLYLHNSFINLFFTALCVTCLQKYQSCQSGNHKNICIISLLSLLISKPKINWKLYRIKSFFLSCSDFIAYSIHLFFLLINLEKAFFLLFLYGLFLHLLTVFTWKRGRKMNRKNAHLRIFGATKKFCSTRSISLNEK